MNRCEGFGKDCDVCGDRDQCDHDSFGFGEGLFIGFLVGAGIISGLAFYFVS